MILSEVLLVAAIALSARLAALVFVFVRFGA